MPSNTLCGSRDKLLVAGRTHENLIEKSMVAEVRLKQLHVKQTGLRRHCLHACKHGLSLQALCDSYVRCRCLRPSGGHCTRTAATSKLCMSCTASSARWSCDALPAV